MFNCSSPPPLTLPPLLPIPSRCSSPPLPSRLSPPSKKVFPQPDLHQEALNHRRPLLSQPPIQPLKECLGMCVCARTSVCFAHQRIARNRMYTLNTWAPCFSRASVLNGCAAKREAPPTPGVGPLERGSGSLCGGKTRGKEPQTRLGGSEGGQRGQVHAGRPTRRSVLPGTR